MKRQTRKPKGFTLIEVLIVVAIVAIASGILLAGSGNGRTNREVETAAREFAGVVREAQSYALSGKQVVADTIPCRSQVSWGGSSYTLTYWYKNGSGTCDQTSVLATYTLKKGVTFSNSSSFYFTLPHAGLSFGSGNVSAGFSKQSSSHIVCVYGPAGRIIDRAGTTCP